MIILYTLFRDFFISLFSLFFDCISIKKISYDLLWFSFNFTLCMYLVYLLSSTSLILISLKLIIFDQFNTPCFWLLFNAYYALLLLFYCFHFFTVFTGPSRESIIILYRQVKTKKKENKRKWRKIGKENSQKLKKLIYVQKIFLSPKNERKVRENIKNRVCEEYSMI